MDDFGIRVVPTPWNKGNLVGQKAPFKLKEIPDYAATSASFSKR